MHGAGEEWVRHSLVIAIADRQGVTLSGAHVTTHGEGTPVGMGLKTLHDLRVRLFSWTASPS